MGTDRVKLCIAGSRKFGTANDRFVNVGVSRLLNSLRLPEASVRLVLSGGCKGADKLGESWAVRRGILIARYLPQGDSPGKFHVRNEGMALDCTCAVLFASWTDGAPESVLDNSHKDNRGTRSMLRYLLKHDKPYQLYAVRPLPGFMRQVTVSRNWHTS